MTDSTNGTTFDDMTDEPQDDGPMKRRRAPRPFTQHDVTRALRAAKAAGYESLQIEFDRDGKFRLSIGMTQAQITPPKDAPRKDNSFADFEAALAKRLGLN